MDIAEVTLAELKLELIDGRLSKGDLFFVVDLGATNTRFGFVPRGASKLFVRFTKVPINSIAVFFAEVTKLASLLGPTVCKRVVASALNLPGPVQGGVGGPIANYQGATNEDKVLRLAELPKALFIEHHTVMLNDLEAGAYGVIAADHFKIFPQLFTTMWSAKGAPAGAVNASHGLGKGHCFVVAPGTGLGNALIQYHSFSDKYTVLPLEFGHTSVQSETETEFLAAHKQELKRGNYMVEYDDLCSGRGLVRLYHWVTRGKPSKRAAITAKDISDLAKGGDVDSIRAFDLYNTFLMRYCSQMAMGFVPSTIVLCGDNFVHNKGIYEQQRVVDAMKATLLDHSMERMGFMSRVAVVRQRELANLNLLGCVFISENAARKLSKL